jgi:hypothetical protein
MAVSLRTGWPRRCESMAIAIARPAEGLLLGGAVGEVDVEVVGVAEARGHAEPAGRAAEDRDGDLDRLLEYVAELAGDDELAGAVRQDGLRRVLADEQVHGRLGRPSIDAADRVALRALQPLADRSADDCGSPAVHVYSSDDRFLVCRDRSSRSVPTRRRSR